MKVLLGADYFPPFNPGGSEWSVYYLSLQLTVRSVSNIVVTPNYGTKKRDNINGVEVIRFPALVQLNNFRKIVSPIWQNNPIFFIWSGYHMYKISKAENVDLIHINGKYLIPAGYIASKLLKIPLVVSIRDKHLICNFGKCLFDKKRIEGCSFWEYLIVDTPWYYRNYVESKNIKSLIFTILSAVWTRLANQTIAWFAKRADKIIAISKSQKKYLEANGFQKVEAIYNTAEIVKNKTKIKRSGVLFAGKLSNGKGTYELIKAIPEVVKYHKEIFKFAGGFESRSEIDGLIKKLKIKKFVNLLGGVDHNKLQSLYQSSKIVVQPSIFPEAFGRVALEGLMAGTPVVVSDTGGLPEIVDDKKTGRVVNANHDSLAAGIKDVLDNLPIYIDNVSKARKRLVTKFYETPLTQHVKLYNSLVQ